MKKLIHIKLIFTVFIAGLFLIAGPSHAPALAQDEELTAREILDKVDDLYRGDSSMGTMTMEIVTEHWSRTLTMDFWTKGKDKSLFKILSPKKERGTATLRSGNDIWNYLPKVNRTIKVPSSMMSQSWMGSHFTNDDLVRETRMADDYAFEKSFEGERDDIEVIEITCIPKPEEAIVWGKVVLTVRASDYIPLVMDYYHDDMELARTMTFSELKDIDGRMIPTKMHVVPTDKELEYTVVTYDEITFDMDIDDDLFSLRNLQD